MADKIYSKRNKPEPDTFTYEISPRVRTRIMECFKGLAENAEHGWPSYSHMMERVCSRCRQAYGTLGKGDTLPPDNVPFMRQVNYHVDTCSDDHVIDFIEMCLGSDAGFLRYEGVARINEIFREEGIGYEFSPYIPPYYDYDNKINVRPAPQATKKEDVPRIVEGGRRLVHDVIQSYVG